MYRIRPLKQAEIVSPLGVAQMLGDMKSFVIAPVFIWLIEGEDGKILVDTGVQRAVSGYVHFSVRGGGEKGVERALASTQTKPREIDTVILTHLHFDHIAQTHLFHDARIYIQKREWESALNPPIHYRIFYDSDKIQKIEEMDVCLVRGDFKLCEGLELIFLPGHTLGLQGVKVGVRSGNYLIAGDHFYSRFNLNPPKRQVEVEGADGNKITIHPTTLPFLPPGLHVNLTDWFDSCFKALNVVRRKRILPGHDPSLVGKTFS
jgi:glyoxylase-like metal-dependent hydrolase (beta-lactamase superfamily II)